ncbi:MAG: hypothetical protein NTV52_10385 [Acidobacteria bacterium]|nr:hypothetical protein [Acidobacteriota bacterium]
MALFLWPHQRDALGSHCPAAGADGGPLAQRLGMNPVLRHTAPAKEGPAGLNLVDWKQIAAEYERHRHGVFPDGKGGYPSRSH